MRQDARNATWTHRRVLAAHNAIHLLSDLGKGVGRQADGSHALQCCCAQLADLPAHAQLPEKRGMLSWLLSWRMRIDFNHDGLVDRIPRSAEWLYQLAKKHLLRHAREENITVEMQIKKTNQNGAFSTSQSTVQTVLGVQKGLTNACFCELSVITETGNQKRRS